MNKLTKEEVEQQLERLRQQEQQNQDLIRIIQRTKPEDLEQERFKNLSEDERKIFGK